MEKNTTILKIKIVICIFFKCFCSDILRKPQNFDKISQFFWPIGHSSITNFLLITIFGIWQKSCYFFQNYVTILEYLNFSKLYLPVWGSIVFSGLFGQGHKLGLNSKATLRRNKPLNHLSGLIFCKLREKNLDGFITQNKDSYSLKKMEAYPHSSLVDFLAQVIYTKNCPITFYCIFQLVWVPRQPPKNL